jgi:hypothetical protein
LFVLREEKRRGRATNVTKSFFFASTQTLPRGLMQNHSAVAANLLSISCVCLSVVCSLSLSLFYFLCVGLDIGPFCLFMLLLVITVVVAVCFVVSPKQQ